MARAHSLPSTFDSVGLQNAPCALGRVILSRNLKLSLQAVSYGQNIATAEEPVLHGAVELAGAQSWGDG